MEILSSKIVLEPCIIIINCYIVVIIIYFCYYKTLTEGQKEQYTSKHS
jgi:hypothetical protein